MLLYWGGRDLMKSIRLTRMIQLISNDPIKRYPPYFKQWGRKAQQNLTNLTYSRESPNNFDNLVQHNLVLKCTITW